MSNVNVAFIPARKGSVRLKNKNIINLAGHPLIAYTIDVAVRSKKFNYIFCITDSKKYQRISNYYGCNFFPLRPKNTSGPVDPDYKWVKWALKILDELDIRFDNFSILRPTNPFRTTRMIKSAFSSFNKNDADSIRAVERTKTHPGKIWIYKNHYLQPLLNRKLKNIPWHSSQYAALPIYYAQNASLEICKKESFKKSKSITGNKILPFFTSGYEGFDINTKLDYDFAKLIMDKKKIRIKKKSFFDV